METAKSYVNQKTLAERVQERLSELKITKTEAGVRIGYHRTAITRYMKGEYGSDVSAIEAALEKFLEETEPGNSNVKFTGIEENFSPVLREKTEFFESRDFMNVIGICNACQESRGLGIVVGRSGFGKSHTLKKYAKLNRVVYIECNETMNCKDIVRRIERKIGLPKGIGSVDERMENVIDFFCINEGYLLILDEADKLITKYTQKKIELIRNIADGAEGKVGIVLAGEPILKSCMENYDERFANRMDFYYRLTGLSMKEIEEYLEGYEIDKEAMTELILRANNKQNGCFRLLDRTLNNILRILKASGKTKITMKVINEASDMMLL